jgi:transposase
MARTYPQEFRDDVVRVARKHQAPLEQVAKDFGIGASTLHKWLKKADAQDGVVTDGPPNDAEVRELKKLNRLLEQENEVLRRAAAYFSQANLPKG